MSSKASKRKIIKVDFKANNLTKAQPTITKGSLTSETVRFEEALVAAKSSMVREIIIGENENGDTQLITNLEDPEECLMLINEAKSFLESFGETPTKDDTD